jgi:DNA-binding NtrC family response regulator
VKTRYSIKAGAMTNKPAILVVAENRAIRNTLLELLTAAGLNAANGGDVPDAILIGCGMRIAAGDLRTAQAMSGKDRRIPVILATSQGSEELAVQSLRAGIADYLALPLTPSDLARAVEAVLPKPAAIATPDRMIGASQVFLAIREYLYRVAVRASNVLITGETGTGKEVAAEFIHRNGSRASKPLIIVNCAAIPGNLIESELFGFERGAFTGAVTAQNGKFKLADGGDILLDEIGELTPHAQAKILRVIETGELQRLGATQVQRVDVRVIAATNRDLETDPTFRKDLFFRLNVARVHLPPLRERREDILPLAEAFRAGFDRKFGCATTFTVAARNLLVAQQWPGNIRELRNIIEASFIDPGPDANGALDLPAPFRKALKDSSGGELQRILSTLSQTHWNKTRAASELHWSRMTLYRKMARYKLGRAAAAAK